MYKFMFVCTKEDAKSKKLPLQGFEHKTSSSDSTCLNRYASSVVESSIELQYMSILVPAGRSARDPPRHPRRP